MESGRLTAVTGVGRRNGPRLERSVKKASGAVADMAFNYK
jgi:hypothetical protein